MVLVSIFAGQQRRHRRREQTHGHSGGGRSSVAQACPTLCDPIGYSLPGLPVHHQLLDFKLKLMSIKSVMSSNHLILCCRLLLLPPVPPSTRVFSNEDGTCRESSTETYTLPYVKQIASGK